MKSNLILSFICAVLLVSIYNAKFDALCLHRYRFSSNSKLVNYMFYNSYIHIFYFFYGIRLLYFILYYVVPDFQRSKNSPEWTHPPPDQTNRLCIRLAIYSKLTYSYN